MSTAKKNIRESEFVLVALGANITFEDGDLVSTLSSAIEHLGRDGDEVLAVSQFYETPCFPAGAGPDYVNAAVAMATKRDPRRFLDKLHRIERLFGRERSVRWGQRTLDLDLLAVGQKIHPDDATFEVWKSMPIETQQIRAPEEMILPHPRMHERAFVLIPLHDVAPDWTHPVLKKTIAQFVEGLSSEDKQAVKAI